MNSFSTINPTTNEPLRAYSYKAWDEADVVLRDASSDFQKWRKTSWAERSEVLRELAQVLRNSKSELAQLMNQEMGKLLAEAKAEVEKCAVTCEFYADEAPQFLQPQQVQGSPYNRALVSFQPLGIIFSIMPWNFPLWQVIRFAAPALMAGNVIVLKHADITAGTAEFLADLFQKISSKYTLLRNLHVNHEEAAKVIADPRVQGVTFTGSSRGGRAVALDAAKSLKKTVLELGGSDAYLVLDDADVESAAKLCAKARLVNCGQSCVAGKRFIVHEKVATEFLKFFTQEMRATELAPLAHKKFQQQIIEQVEKMKSWGGRVVLGGTVPQMPGAFYPATVIVFDKSHPLAHAEEVFGPVASVFVVKSAEEAMTLANASPYGLGGGVFTRNTEWAKEWIETELAAGFVVVNDYVKSDPHLPFGGVKQSGYGRELGAFGIMEFVNIKTVAIAGDLG